MTLGDLQKRYDEVVAFIASPLHAEYKRGVEAELKETESNILARPPVNAEETAVVLQLFGEKARLEVFQTTFEVLRDGLRADIDQLVESEQLVVKTTETENDEE